MPIFIEIGLTVHSWFFDFQIFEKIVSNLGSSVHESMKDSLTHEQASAHL